MQIHDWDDAPDVLWAGEGIAHRIMVTKSSNSGWAIVSVEGIRNMEKAQTATLSPEERKSLAKALYPEGFKDEA